MQNINSLQRIFLGLFIVSTAIVLTLSLTLNKINALNPSPTGDPSVLPTQAIDAPEENPSTSTPQSTQNSSALIGSVIASATSLVGFVMTTVVTWRKEKRESALADVQHKKLETELEKSRLELEKLKKASSKKKAKK